MSRDDANDESGVDLLVTLGPGASALVLGGLLLPLRATMLASLDGR